MKSFGQRLREEIEYKGMLQKEVAAEAGIKKRALDMYLGPQASIPPADVAVRLAKVLNVSVEYLVTGEDCDNAQSEPQSDIQLISSKCKSLQQKERQIILDLVQSLILRLHKKNENI